MSQTTTLIDVSEGIFRENETIDAASLGSRSAGSDWTVRMQRLRGGLSDGVDVVNLDNGLMKLSVLPTRGMGIWKGEIAGTDLGWNSPVERPVHPSYVDEMRRGGIGWLDAFNEMICRCGLGWHGAPGTDVRKDADGNIVSEQFLPLHGRVANLSAHQVHVELSDDGAVSVVGIVDEASMFGGRLRLTSRLTTRADCNWFEIEDTVQNLGSAPAEVEMLYHCNFGRPFLGAGATFHTAAGEVAPRNARAADGIASWDRYSDAEQGFEEQVYFMNPLADADGRGAAVLRAPDGDKAISIRFDVSTLPWLTLWKNTQAEADGYCTGLEPGTGFPNLRMFERENNRVVSLNCEESVTFRLDVSVALHADDVAKTTSELDAQQSDVERVVHSVPKADWSE